MQTNKQSNENKNFLRNQLNSASTIKKKVYREEGDKKNIKCLLPYEKMVLINKCICGKDHDKEGLDHR